MTRITLNLQDSMRDRLHEAAAKTGFSETDLAKALLSAGLDQMEGDGVVIRVPCPASRTFKPEEAVLTK